MTPQEKSKLIFEALFPDECWHYPDSKPERDNILGKCVRCKEWFALDGSEHPNYFSPRLPDNTRVKLVTAVGYRWSSTQIQNAMNVDDIQTLWRLPVRVIAEAIYRLITKEK